MLFLSTWLEVELRRRNCHVVDAWMGFLGCFGDCYDYGNIYTVTKFKMKVLELIGNSAPLEALFW